MAAGKSSAVDRKLLAAKAVYFCRFCIQAYDLCRALSKVPAKPSHLQTLPALQACRDWTPTHKRPLNGARKEGPSAQGGHMHLWAAEALPRG